MPTTILIARHGETDWNREHRWQGHADPPLNDTGRRQARELAARLEAAPPGAVYSSDLSRAHETAEIVAAALGLAVGVEPRLREVDVGEWSGLTSQEVEERFPEGLRRWREGETGWTQGETLAELGVRIVAALEAIAANHPDGRVLVVTHGGALRAVWNAAGLPAEERPRYPNCAVEVLSLESGRIRRIDSLQGGGLHQQVQG